MTEESDVPKQKNRKPTQDADSAFRDTMMAHPAAKAYLALPTDVAAAMGPVSLRKLTEDWDEQTRLLKLQQERIAVEETLSEENPPAWQLRRAKHLESIPFMKLLRSEEIRGLQTPYDLASYEENIETKRGLVHLVFQWPVEHDNLHLRTRVKIAAREAIYDYQGNDPAEAKTLVKKAIAPEAHEIGIPVVRVRLTAAHLPEPKPERKPRILT